MQTNASPYYDASDNPTNCCPRFNPTGWDHQHLRFENKRFVKATTFSVFHIPLNMGSVFGKVQRAIDAAKAGNLDQTLILSEDLSAWKADHYFAVDKDVPGQSMATLSGELLTQVFEGPFSKAKEWCDALKVEADKAGRKAGRLFYFYTTCPKCAKVYGKNYVVGLVELK